MTQQPRTILKLILAVCLAVIVVGTLVLQNNGADNLGRSVDGNFTFATAIAGTYNVTVLSQPAGQTCTVNTTALNVRRCAGVECAVTGWLHAGAQVTVAPSRDLAPNWAALVTGGYVNSSFLTCNP